MLLEALELAERGECGVLVIEMGDQPEINPVVLGVVAKAAAACGIAQGVAHEMGDLAGLVLCRIDFPDFLDAQPVFLRRTAFVETELGDQPLGEGAAGTFGDQGIFGAQLYPGGEGWLVAAVAGNAHIASDDAEDFSVLAGQKIGGGGAGKNIDAQRFGLLGQPAAKIAQRNDDPTLGLHDGRHQEVGKCNC